MADNRTMAQMLQAPIEGYEDAIVVPTINANNFELKQTLINLVQSQVFQPPTNQPPVYQVPPYQAPTPQIQGVSKTDFENYVKANDAVLKNVQNQGTLPSQTVTNPRQQINAITTRSVSFLVIDFSKDDPFSGSTTTHSDDPSPSSSPVKTSDNLEEFID
ncbi:hypothetical protein Tco_0370271 [Tanacetum coccineum]